MSGATGRASARLVAAARRAAAVRRSAAAVPAPRAPQDDETVEVGRDELAKVVAIPAPRAPQDDETVEISRDGLAGIALAPAHRAPEDDKTVEISRDELAGIAPAPRAPQDDETVEVGRDELAKVVAIPAPRAPGDDETVEVGRDELAQEAPPSGTVRISEPTGWLAAHVPLLGQAPWILATSSAGVAVVALAYSGGRTGAGWAVAAYWLGQVLVFAPVAVRMLARLAGTAEAYALVVGLAANQYLQKWMYSPDEFRFPDELQHWAATSTLVRTAHLYEPEHGLPVAEHFPGLAEMGGSVALLTGLPVTVAGLIVAGVAHLAFVSLIFAVVRRVGGSPRLAGLTCVVYATSLHYLFFDSMYVYQTGALPFLMLAVWAALCWQYERRVLAHLAIGGFAIASVVVTHHITAMMTVGTLLLIGVCEMVLSRPRRYGALILGGFAAAATLAWFTFVASDVTTYLSPAARGLWRSGIRLLHGEIGGPPTGAARPPLWETGVSVLALLALFALFVQQLRTAITTRSRDVWHWSLLTGTFVFFATAGLRFVGSQGPELAGRAATFTYVPVSLLAASSVLAWRRNGGLRIRRHLATTRTRIAFTWSLAIGLTMLLMVNSRVGGWPSFWGRLPGGFVASGFERAVDPMGVSAARWSRAYLGGGHRFAADTNGFNLVSTYGGQRVVRETAPLFYSTAWGLADQELVKARSVEFVYVDIRLADQLPVTGSYFPRDPMAGRRTGPIDRAGLTKFDGINGADRVYDNGTVRIYDLRDS
ncbi:hypothetical protein [Dactylosporangium sp. CA-233914]|uniref:hypothetical protein n=1 Tax=Dactylosporangium sp. CA-233914 TaxID=3239934 RepID=UPI003D8A6E3D